MILLFSAFLRPLPMHLRALLPRLRGVSPRVLLAFTALLLALPLAAHAQPQRVWVGMYVVDLTELDLKSGAYTADFYLWLRWDGPHDPTKFEIMNGSGDPCAPNQTQQHGRVRYAVFRCLYTFHRNFDLSAYPLDRQELTVEVEDQSLSRAELVYVPDQEHTALDSAVSLPGWKTGALWLREETHAYTSLGNPALLHSPGARYSRLVLTVPLEREGVGIYFKSFLVMFLSVGVGLIGALLRCEHIDARLGLGLASIFGVVSSYMVVAQALPETAQFTMADKLHLVGIVCVFVSILSTVVAYNLAGSAGEEGASRLDRRLALGTAVGFVAAAVFISVGL